MFDRILRQMRDRVRAQEYAVTIHADDEEMDADGSTISDVENVILSGTIVERQKDTKTGEPKYVVRGKSLDGGDATAVARLGQTGKLIFITVYREQTR